MKIKVRHATTNREFTIDTAILEILDPPQNWLAYDNAAPGNGWITDPIHLNRLMMRAGSDRDVWVPATEQMQCDYCDSIEAMTGTKNCPIHGANL